MPNWVKHDLTITGPKSELDAFIHQCCTANDKGALNLDFERIVTKPEGFDCDMTSPLPLYLDVLNDDKRYHDALAYPWVQVEFNAEGCEPRDLSRFIYRRMHAMRCAPLSNTEVDALIHEQAEGYARNTALGGHPTWYEWNCANWGTKWNACDCSITFEPNADGIGLRFMTAWDSPRPIFQKITERYPNLKFSGTIDEEGGYFWMVLKDNNIVEHGDGVRPGGPYDYAGDDEGEEDEAE